MTVSLYQHSDNTITVNLVNDVTGEAVSASSFIKAEYVIADSKRNVKLRLKLNDGIKVEGENFKIFIDDSKLDNSFKGKFYHQMVVWNVKNEKLPPIFSSIIEITPVIK